MLVRLCTEPRCNASLTTQLAAVLMGVLFTFIRQACWYVVGVMASCCYSGWLVAPVYLHKRVAWWYW
jgi:hypothetical protein